MQDNKNNMLATPRQIDSLLNMSSFVEAIYDNHLKKYKQSKIYPFPFNVTDDIIRNIDKNAREKIGVSENNKIRFNALVTFQDLLSSNYDDFDIFLNEAAKERDPESASLSWSTFIPDGKPIARYITIDFITEKKLTTSESEPGDIFHASINLTVCGTDSTWVKETFNSFKPLVDLCKLSGIFRPLWIFRNTFFIRIISMFIALFSGIVGGNIFNMLSTSTKISNTYNLKLETFHKETKILEDIKSTCDIGNKIDILSEYVINPINPTKPGAFSLSGTVLDTIAYISTILFIYVVLYFTCLTLLPKLAPSSHLSIGLNRIRVERHLNTIKFIIFDLLLLGILVPIIVKFIS
jgi:hypothetical protein